MERKCNNCVHEEVCSIYEFAKKYNETSLVKFKSYTIVDVCEDENECKRLDDEKEIIKEAKKLQMESEEVVEEAKKLMFFN